MKHKNINVKDVAENLSNFIYADNLQATKELMELFDRIKKMCPLNSLSTWKDYVKMYDDNFYTYQSWTELIESEKEQNDGLTEEECKNALNHIIWKLPCGWYVQYV